MNPRPKSSVRMSAVHLWMFFQTMSILTANTKCKQCWSCNGEIRLRFRLVVVDARMRHTSLTTEQENFRVKKIQLTMRWNTIRIFPDKKWWWNVTYVIVHGTLRSRNGLAMRLVIGHAIDSLKDPRRELAIEFWSNIAIGLQRPCDGPPMVL